MCAVIYHTANFVRGGGGSSALPNSELKSLLQSCYSAIFTFPEFWRPFESFLNWQACSMSASNDTNAKLSLFAVALLKHLGERLFSLTHTRTNERTNKYFPEFSKAISK